MSKITGPILIVLLLISALPLAAQSDDLADQWFAALDMGDNYSSYTAESLESYTQNLLLDLGDQTEEQNLTVVTSSEIQYIRINDLPNVQEILVMDVEQTGSAPFAYTINAEKRVVDGALYVLASYEQADNTLPFLPEGWQLVTDGDAYPGWAELDLNDTLNRVDSVQAISQIDEEIRALLLEYATFGAEESTQAGETVTTLTATLTGEGTRAFLLAASDPEELAANPAGMAVLEAAEGTVTINLVINAEGQVIAYGATQLLDYSVPFSALNPAAPPDSVLAVVQDASVSYKLDNINVGLDHVTAPDGFSE